jgi:Tocopherol cyclase
MSSPDREAAPSASVASPSTSPPTSSSSRASAAAPAESAARGLREGWLTEADNRRRWDGRPGHYEVWYLTLNHRPSRTGAWLRYTLEAPVGGGDAHAGLWFAHFDAREPDRTFGIHREFPVRDLVAQDSPFALALPGALMAHDRTRGALSGAGHSAAWDLAWTPSARTHRQLPSLFYLRGGLGGTTVLSPNLNVPVSGWIEADGRRFDLTDEPGGQTHLLGRKHAHGWAWGHCNAFEGRPDIAFETLTARLERRGRVLPPLTVLSLHLGDEVLRWNRLHDVAFARGQFGTAFYRFSAAAPRCRVEGEFSCQPHDMVQAEYRDPDGTAVHCANTEIADLRLTLFRRASPFGRWREAARLHAPRSGHFEVAGRERDPAIGKAHRRI